MEKTLIVASSEKAQQFIADLLKQWQQTDITVLCSGNEVRRTLVDKMFDTVIINTPLADEKGYDLSAFIAQQTSSGVLLMVKAEDADEIAYRVEEYGVFVVPKPLNRGLFFQALKLMNASRKRVYKLQEENSKLKQKIETIRLVNQAKSALMMYHNMTEEQAHHYIEKQAMDRRIAREEMASNILRTYELY